MRVLEADHHRNGVAGDGYYVALVKLDDRYMLVTWFPEYTVEDPDVLERCQSRVAAVDVFMASTGNIYTHPEGDFAGGNAWRSAETFAEALPEIVRICDARFTRHIEALRERKPA